MRHLLGLLVLFFCVFATPAAAGVADERTRIVVDMRGKAVTVPLVPRRVATINDGFVEGVMTHLGVIDTLAAIGSWGMKRDYRYEFTARSGETYEYRGLSTMKFLHPWLDDLPIVNSPQGNVLNFEVLAKAEPDLVILRVGDCTVGAGNREAIDKTINTIEALGLPLLVLYAPNAFGGADLSGMRQEMAVIGEAFEQQEKALALADRLAGVEAMIRVRTQDIPEAERVSLLYFGLHPTIRSAGGAGSVWGLDSPESYLIEQVANARNAFSGRGHGVPMSAEQIYALDPDVIVLPTAGGYHPARELYEAPYYANLAELRAVKARRVYAMPWTPMNCARRLEYPLDMLIIAKAAYPERFRDVSVYDKALQLYKDLYHVDDATAQGLAATQLLEWMIPAGF